MAFEIVELNEETFTGTKTEIPEFDPQKGFGPMSEIKESAFTKFAKNEKDYVGINASLDGLQYYVVASVDGNGDTTFDIPAGKYAKFVTAKTDRPALDGFIGAAYGEVSQSSDVGIAGSFNLEDLREAEFTLYIPVVAK
ncbi:hypothetical protein C1903_08730 [Listeria ivanovii]|uniref:GyrI-like domain-containing protein n=1 Tax=Listeria ivanovii TaxID=1638 RepID=UPI000DA97A73|nr:GyrI-like domain-containing protein [Listeria ivanovii]PZF88748.1 hypothetical protein C1905_09035 [Listeria ivanovii]PZF93901.1 hypothetical protein C1903_08730 [Listeria ivanovii]PZG04725.1 hypothetical protein C2L88_08515 [Listeria ivanovii]PZG09129.1 hypothetical protein C1901_08870 [Listeria ivanovii]PZG26073.1 hypothetical protein C1900_09045 [Listeria ivanovii]